MGGRGQQRPAASRSRVIARDRGHADHRAEVEAAVVDGDLREAGHAMKRDQRIGSQRARVRIIGTSAVPPGTTLASPPARPSASTASATLCGAISSKGGGASRRRPSGGGEHRVDDLDVARAPAQVPGERFPHFVRARRWILGQSARADRIMPGVQNPHWAAPEPRKGVLQRIERIALEPFDRHERAAGEPRRQHQARADRLAVEQDGARAAHAFAAPVLGAGEREDVPDEIEDREVRRRIDPARPAVEREIEARASWRTLASVSRASTRSAVSGSSVTRRPTARDTAFITAAGVGVIAGSPMPLAPKGPARCPTRS